jgi:hypothetical protein
MRYIRSGAARAARMASSCGTGSSRAHPVAGLANSTSATQQSRDFARQCGLPGALTLNSRAGECDAVSRSSAQAIVWIIVGLLGEASPR